MTWTVIAAVVVVVVVVVLVLAAMSLKVLREYERAVVFRFGRLRPLLGPGPHLLLPLLNQLVRIDLRVVTLGSARWLASSFWSTGGAPLGRSSWRRPRPTR